MGPVEERLQACPTHIARCRDALLCLADFRDVPTRGEGFILEPPTEPPGFRSTDWLFPPACSSICLVVPWALAVAIPATSTAATKIVLRVFISNSLSINV